MTHNSEKRLLRKTRATHNRFGMTRNQARRAKRKFGFKII